MCPGGEFDERIFPAEDGEILGPSGDSFGASDRTVAPRDGGGDVKCRGRVWRSVEGACGDVATRPLAESAVVLTPSWETTGAEMMTCDPPKEGPPKKVVLPRKQTSTYMVYNRLG